MTQLVSALMPTYNRRAFLPMAIRSFLAQDYAEKELIIVDDGNDGSEEVVRRFDGRIRYVRCDRLRIGAKLNLATEVALGDVLVRWDSDDWSEPGRITDQVKRLEQSGKAVTGYHSLLFWHEAEKQASKYSNDDHAYSCGSCLCYQKDFWESHRFIDSSVCEDNDFVQRAQREGQIISVDAGQMMVANIHADNTSAKTGPLKWPAVDVSEIPQAFFEAMR